MTLAEIHKEAGQARETLENAAAVFGRDIKIYLHWTAGRYDTIFSDYHFCIKGDGTIENTLPIETTPEATYMRNSGSVSIAVCACYDGYAFGGGAYDLGAYAPTGIQIEAMAQAVATLCDALRIPCDLAHVMTHAEAGDNLDGYEACAPYGPLHGCVRWDLAVTKQGDEWGTGGDILRGKAIYYGKALYGWE